MSHFSTETSGLNSEDGLIKGYCSIEEFESRKSYYRFMLYNMQHRPVATIFCRLIRKKGIFATNINFLELTFLFFFL